MRVKLVITLSTIALVIVALVGTSSVINAASSTPDGNPTVIDTSQSYCYSETGTSIPCPSPGEALFGQDANYVSTAPAYTDNGDGTITDLNTGLMWVKSPGGKMSWQEAMDGAASFNLAGYTDWRVPTIKELYSLIDFDGITGTEAANSIPYIDTTYFDFEYGDVAAGERMIDAQYWSNTEYTSTTMNGDSSVFGVNFADGRIKSYPTILASGQPAPARFIRYVRGTTSYGTNDFQDNGDGTITDLGTGLTWMQTDSGALGAGSNNDGNLNWSEALSFCENLDYAGQTDWRLPDAKELQGIVDYSRSLDATDSAAIDPIFASTPIVDEGGQADYAFYWTSTTHLDGQRLGDRAVYIAFGEALGYMNNQFMDVHGAGAQRSDLKTGDPSSLPRGQGPQGDVQRIYNAARCVRGGNVTVSTGGSTDTRWQAQPKNTPPQSQNQPPQQAIDACTGLSVNAACTLNSLNSTLTGTCASIQNTLTCVPTNGHGG